jgi:D-alanyl-D-alanine carboxypeptidase
MPPLGTVESVQPIAAAPPNLRDEMCGGHRKRPASEDEDDLAVASNNPETPYAVFLASLRPGKKGAAPLQEVKMGEPVLVYTGTKPPAPGAQASTESKPEKKKAAAIKPTAKDKDDASATSAAASRAAPKPKPKSPAAKDGGKDAAKDGASTAAASSGDAAASKPKPKVRKDAAKDGAAATGAASDDATAPKPKPKKPAPKPPPMTITPAAEQSSQVR